MKDDSFFSMISETIARRNPQVAALLDRNNRIMADLKKQHQSDMKRLEQEKSERLIKFLKEFSDKFEETPKVDREELIKVNEANLQQLKIEAQLRKQSGQIKECEEKLSILKEFYPMIDKIPYKVSQIATPSEKDKKSSFNLISQASSGLNDLRKCLIESKLINEVNSHDFKSVFFNDIPTTTIDWNVKGELKYFVKKLCNETSLFKTKPTQYYVIAADCFTVKGKNLSNTEIDRTHITSNTKSKNKIDRAIATLKRSVFFE